MVGTCRSELDQTIDVIETMTDEELQALRTVAFLLINKKPIERPYLKLTEEEFFRRIDSGISELDAGLGEESDVVDSEISKEYGLAM